MIANITAIYEGGVLRPTEPIALAEGTKVEVTLKMASQVSWKEDEAPAAQKPTDGQTAFAILSQIAALPMRPGPEFSGRDHDDILYGERGGQ